MYGAHRTNHQPKEPTMATAETDTTTGQPKRVGSYADRRIVAQRVDGNVQLRDEPAGGQGRTYLIEPNLGLMSELKALVADYKATASRIEDVPMAHCWW